jgi:hypothetical protein|tara:strand:- start:4647 stop:4829 length:183 start_codon:yes stop_codon:yes gene_type:complete
MDDLPKIECTTIVTWRNTNTGEVFKEKKEGEDIVQDVTVQVSPKGLEILQKVLKRDKSNK